MVLSYFSISRIDLMPIDFPADFDAPQYYRPDHRPVTAIYGPEHPGPQRSPAANRASVPAHFSPYLVDATTGNQVVRTPDEQKFLDRMIFQDIIIRARLVTPPSRPGDYDIYEYRVNALYSIRRDLLPFLQKGWIPKITMITPIGNGGSIMITFEVPGERTLYVKNFNYNGDSLVNNSGPSLTPDNSHYAQLSAETRRLIDGLPKFIDAVGLELGLCTNFAIMSELHTLQQQTIADPAFVDTAVRDFSCTLKGSLFSSSLARLHAQAENIFGHDPFDLEPPSITLDDHARDIEQLGTPLTIEMDRIDEVNE